VGRPADLGSGEGGAAVDRGGDEQHEHIPVLVESVVEELVVRPNDGQYLDATVGGGGHTAAILEATGPNGRVLGLDRDAEAATRARLRLKSFGDRVTIVHASYVTLLDVARREGFYPLDGVLFDLGFSSFQIDDARRGFSFGLPGPLDMRYDSGSGATAAELVNQLSEAELVELLFKYGEERRSRQIAKAIVRARPIETTTQLADVVARAVGGRRSAIHPATRTFQALRIAVNEELSGIETALPDAVAALRSGGRLAVISFHSLEDRIVKHFMQQESRDCICPPELPVCQCDHVRSLRLMTRGPIVPSDDEVSVNPRSRSAKLRIAEKV
jgi:16S rRNA (cytosine1402-N4)-methyltransferase